jgi:molybdate transport system ATP-binding protein
VLVNALLGRSPVAQGEIAGPNGRESEPELAPEDASALVSPATHRALVLGESTFYQSRWHSGIQEGQRTVAQFLSQESVEGWNPFEVNRVRRRERAFQRRRQQWVEWLGIRTLLRRQIAHLSNGEVRRVLLVHALLSEPRLLILEDSMAGLDIASRRTVRRVITRLMRAGWPVLVVTHRAEEVPKPTTHLLLVAHGAVVAQGPKSEMLHLWRRRYERTSTVAHRRLEPGKSTGPQERRCRTGEPIVELDKLRIVAGRKRILNDVTWRIRQRERWLVLGPNGAGKTTLLNVIQGDHPQAYSQSMRLFGQSTESTQTLWNSRQCLGWMSPEIHHHYPGDCRVVDVIVSGFFNTLGLYEHCTRRQRSVAREWLDELGLRRHAGALFHELSFGEQRLVLLGRAMVKRPRLLILDEPCQGLDASQRTRLLAAVDRVLGQVETSLIFVTHHPRERPRCITHTVRLVGGRLCCARSVS